MPYSKEKNLNFLTEAMTRITGSLDIQKSLIDTFDFLAEHFPIEAISLHQYSMRLESLKLLFLVQKGRFDFVETTAQIPPKEVPWMKLFHKGLAEPITMGDNTGDTISNVHAQALSPWIEYKERQYLIGRLGSEDQLVGHLCLMGKAPDCFNEEHKRKLELLLHPFTLAMSNLLEHKRTIDFQKSLHAEKQQLRSDLELLKDTRIVGKDNGMKKTMETVHQLKGSELPALIIGETGTGKELLADTIQAISPRKDKPFIKVNCGAIPDTLVDSELFGYEKGAFTGASTSRPGRFEQAHGGTLFLDEIGELPLQAQVRLLRVLQNNVVERIGSTKSIKVDVRVIAATNRNLELMMQEGTFREDLYYRLYVFPIHVPPLRDRSQDIPELVQLFQRRTCDKLGIKAQPQIPQTTLQRLLKYSWPGNIRELENLVKRGLTLYQKGPLLLDELLPQDEGWYIAPEESQSYFEKTIDARVEAVLEKHLSKLHMTPESTPTSPSNHLGMPVEIKPLEETIGDAIQTALTKAHGKISGPGGAAELLAVNPNTLRSKMRKMGINSTRNLK